MPWSKAANEDGTFSSDAELTELYSRRSTTEGHHRLLPDRRALQPHLVRATEILGKQSVKNYDGSWTEYGSLVGVPVETGA